MSTLLLSPRRTDDGALLEDAGREIGWTVRVLDSWRVDRGSFEGRSLAIYGEPLFARVIAAQCERVLLEPEPGWLTEIPVDATQREIRLLQFKDVAELDGPLFIKPPDDKVFAARVYEDPSDLLQRQGIDPNQPVIVSEVVRFEREYRTHVLQGEVVACSRYSVQGELDVACHDPYAQHATAFAEEVLLAVGDSLPPAVVLDVGRLPDGTWAVVEANPVFGAGIYANDPRKVLPVLAQACLAASAVPAELERFTFPLELE